VSACQRRDRNTERYSDRYTVVALGGQLSHLRPEVSRLERVRYRRGRTSRQSHEVGPESPTPLSVRRPQQRVTASLLSDLIAGYEAGETTYQLARKYGINRNTVAAHLRSAGVTIRMDGMTPEQIEQAVEYYKTGWPLAQVGRELGADAETVRKRLHERGVAMPVRPARQNGVNVLAAQHHDVPITEPGHEDAVELQQLPEHKCRG
jgi:hypothetical protein